MSLGPPDGSDCRTASPSTGSGTRLLPLSPGRADTGPDRAAAVFGEEVVVVVDAGELTHNNLSELEEGKPISGHGLRLHLLVAGQQLDLATRKVRG